ncbi:MAG: radical SAM protein [Chloroflexi bacterium]|nr:radical SAM protein [Chloroflexota bacterium]
MDPLTKLYIEITTHCNLDCQMCVRRAWNQPIGHMLANTYRGLIDGLRDFPTPPTVHLGGYGEPMSHPEFLDVVEMAKTVGARVEVTTNGCMLSEAMASALIELDLDRLVVSIDSATPDQYEDIRVKASFQDVIDNMRRLYRLKLHRANRHSNPQVGIAFVAMRSNVAEIPKLPQLATQIGAWDVQVSNVIPHTREMEAEILYDDALTACAYRASPWVVNVSLPKMDMNPDTHTPFYDLFNSRASLSLVGNSLSARNDYCRFAQEGFAVVRWDGAVSPCLSLLHDHPEYIRHRRKNVTAYTVGNVNEQPLHAIWASDEFAGFRSRLRAFEFSPCTTCGGCERFPRNDEDCQENYFPVCGGCLWAQGIIECP